MVVKSGTFSATGQSAVYRGRNFNVSMQFGSGSVDIERQLSDDSWVKLADATAITADSDLVLEYPSSVNIRLNCTSYTSAIAYDVLTPDNES